MIEGKYRDEIFEKKYGMFVDGLNVTTSLRPICKKLSCENQNIQGLLCRKCVIFELWLSNEYLEDKCFG